VAQNEVKIIVTSDNRTKEGFASAKADAERAGDEAGQGFAAKFGQRLGNFLTSANSGGFAGEGQGFLNFLTSGPGLAAAATAAGTLLVELDGLLSGFTAATAGAGAFYLLSHNFINQLTQDYGNLQSAQEAVQKAQDKYTLDPTKGNLKALQTAQLNLKAVQMGAQQDLGTAAGPMDQLAAAFTRIQAAFQPEMMRVFTNLIVLLNQMLPMVLPLAEAFANALDTVLIQASRFIQSPGFQKWFQQFLALVGPSTQAILDGVGKVAVAFGNLITVMSKKDVVNAINIAFSVLAGTIQGLADAIQIIMTAWDYGWHFIERLVLNTIGIILTAAAKAFGWVPGLGPQLQQAAASFNIFAAQVLGDLGQLQGAAASTVGLFTGVGFAAANAFNKAPPGGIPGAGPSSGKIGHLAGGGYGSGWTVVGENGPELVNLPGGSYVTPASQLQGGYGGGQLQISMAPGSGNQWERLMLQSIRLLVLKNGGGGPQSVQIAFGQVH